MVRATECLRNLPPLWNGNAVKYERLCHDAGEVPASYRVFDTLKKKRKEELQMKYFRVTEQVHSTELEIVRRKNKMPSNRIVTFLPEKALYTEKEMLRYNIPAEFCERIEVSKRKTYFSFGARFQKRELAN